MSASFHFESLLFELFYGEVRESWHRRKGLVLPKKQPIITHGLVGRITDREKMKMIEKELLRIIKLPCG